MGYDEVMAVLQAKVADCGSLNKASRYFDVSLSYLSDVAKGKRPLSRKLLTGLGLREVRSYERLQEEEAPV